ncbi:MAG: fructose-specific PTS transporter subunit EIIC [Eubacteriales bacterium]|nr:fructose-specific PTS transporter subunit EIIC [Eubacteriales bacterium]
MNIKDLLKPESILINADVKTKDEAIRTLIDLHDKAGNISDKEVYTEGILKRESESTTAVGEGIAIPHCKSGAVAHPGLTAMTVPEGIDYGAPDGKPSNLIFMIAAPLDGDLHLEVLSRLMTLLMDLDLRQKLLTAKSGQEFLDMLTEAEKAKYPDEVVDEPEDSAKPEAAEAQAEPDDHYRVLAVTACPTGIAHTYMAAEALNQKAKEMDIPIKVETNGSGGAKNILTPEEIEQAEAIIIAADKNVEMARFDGKKLLSTKVADGINKPEELINEALSDDTPIYHHKGGGAHVKSSGEPESAGHKIYKHLMNGVSHMLPFVIGGGILIAIAFLIDTIAGAPRDGNFGTYTAAAAFFKAIGGVAFNFMLPVLAGFIAESIADRPGLAVGFTGGSIATLGCTFASPTGDTAAVSGFLGALLAGFIGGLIVILLRKLFAWLPETIARMMPVLIIPVLGVLLMGMFMCAINPVVGLLNTGLTNALKSMNGTSSILLGAIVAGMMAIDMGGPFNKASYIFGTMMLSEGVYNIMAAVMIGGMIPPIAIALSTTFFKNRWTENERKSGPVNYVMGLCFITEGAIPYAAADPLRVIPACIVGSAISGAMSMAFGCELMAPHGGIFVFPVVTHVVGYLIALVVGSLVSMVLLSLLKKKKTDEEQKDEGSGEGLVLE